MNGLAGLPEEMRPRERLMRAVSAEELSDEELLAVLLRTGSRNCSVEELAGRLAIALRMVLDNPHAPCDWRSLAARVDEYNHRHPARPIRGVGPVKMLELAAAFELSRRRYRRATTVDFAQISLRSSAAAFDLFRRVVARHPEQENFFVLPMDSAFHPLCEPIAVTKGGVAAVAVHPPRRWFISPSSTIWCWRGRTSSRSARWASCHLRDARGAERFGKTIVLHGARKWNFDRCF